MIMVRYHRAGPGAALAPEKQVGVSSLPEANQPTTARGPASPTASAAVAHRPPDGPGIRLTGGLLHDWQRRSHTASLPLALRQMEAAGNLDNLRLAIAGAHDGYRGPVFMDSDIYKTLEAIGWELGHAPAANLSEFAASATTLLEEAQQPDGYLNSYIQVSGEPRYQRLSISSRRRSRTRGCPAGPRSSRSPGASPTTWSRRSRAARRASTGTR
jgi:Beta-L-arabinofuranosidase, GH127